MNKFQIAKELIANYKFPEILKKYGEHILVSYYRKDVRGWYYNGNHSIPFKEMTSSVLLESFNHYIELLTESTVEEKIPLGSSKYKGLPHLPKSEAWPEGYYFLAQLNFKELKPYDIEDLLPDDGILYLFHDTLGECKAIYYQDSIDEISITKYPEKVSENDEYYLSEYKDGPELIRFSSKLIFYIGEGDAYDYSEILKFIPDDLKEEIEKQTGAAIAKSDTDLRIFGRPIFWQGEDEYYEEGEEYFEDEMEEGFITGGLFVLLFHCEFGEGNIHFWIDKTQLKMGDFSKIHMSYSGT